jgi:hypothetical protein
MFYKYIGLSELIIEIVVIKTSLIKYEVNKKRISVDNFSYNYHYY